MLGDLINYDILIMREYTILINVITMILRYRPKSFAYIKTISVLL